MPPVNHLQNPTERMALLGGTQFIGPDPVRQLGLRLPFGQFIAALIAGVPIVAPDPLAGDVVPGGVGVFESVLLLIFRAVPADHLLGALLAYRIIYYFGPFAVALALLGSHEVWVHRGPMVRLARLGRTWLSAVTPQAIGVALFGAGAVLLFSGATPAISDRLMWLARFVPLWSLATQTERETRRRASSAEERKEFYDAIVPRLATILEYLNHFPLIGMADDACRLMRLTLSIAEIAPTVELYKGSATVPFSFKETRFIAVHGARKD